MSVLLATIGLPRHTLVTMRIYCPLVKVASIQQSLVLATMVGVYVSFVLLSNYSLLPCKGVLQLWDGGALQGVRNLLSSNFFAAAMV